MTQRAWIAALALAGLVAAVAWALLRPGLATPMADNRLASHSGPARLCASHPPARLEAFKQGTQQLVVVVKAFTPPQGGGGLVAQLVTHDGKRHELARFAVHPLRAFTASEPQRSQRFPLTLSGVGHLLDSGKPVCVEVGFVPAAGAAHGGQAEIDIETAKTP
jgi:hypothetical protein